MIDPDERTLEELKTAFSESDLKIAVDVLDALEFAHNLQGADGRPLGIVHRDIKPANIRITPSGEVKVLDFGVARAAFVGRESHTQSMALGSLGYFSPERFDGIDTPAADIYALGIVVLEALLGRTAGQFSVHHRVHQRKLARLLDEMDQSLPAPFSVRLKPLLASMMAYEWQQRPSAAQVTDAFQDLLLVADGPWLKRWAAGAIEQVEPTPPPDLKPSHEETLPLVAPAATPQGFGIHPRARRLFLLAAAILATVLALASVFAGGAWLWWRASPVVSTRGNHATNIQDHLPAPEAAAILPAESPVASQERVTGSIPEQKPAKNPKASATPPTTNKPRPPVQAPPKARDMVSSPIQESPPTGQVVFKGAVESVRLRDANGKEYAPGQVPVGTYDLLVVFNGGASISLDELVKVKHGETTVVRCDAVAENCR